MRQCSFHPVYRFPLNAVFRFFEGGDVHRVRIAAALVDPNTQTRGLGETQTGFSQFAPAEPLAGPPGSTRISHERVKSVFPERGFRGFLRLFRRRVGGNLDG